MIKHLNVLIVEDSEDDAVLLLREIKKGGYDPTFVRVETAGDMLARLNEQTWDIIISDYSLPEFSAPEALETLRKTGLDLPFIIVSGKVEDEVAVKCMTEGAHDFIRKDNMVRLIPAIKRELSDFIVRKEHEKTEIALKENEKLLTAIAENYPNSYVSIVEKDLTIGFSSGKEFNNQNLDPESFVGFTLDKIFGEQTPIVKQHYLETFGGNETTFELFINEQYQKYNTVPLFDENGKVQRILSVVENITERKKAEITIKESQQRMKLALEETDQGLWDWNVVTGEVSFDNNWPTVLGYTPGERKFDFEWWSNSIHPDSQPVFENALAYYLEGREKYYELEYQITNKTGEWVWIWARGTCISYDEDKNPLRFIGTNRDITERKKAKEQMQLNSLRMNATLHLHKMTKASFSEIADFVLENISLVTKSEYGFVGLMNEDESIFTIHSWSKEAMDVCAVDNKPIDYPIENAGVWGDAIRERKVIIVNEYSDPNTHRTGLPEGHVPLSRILSIPTFDGDKIVAVAAVANKETNYNDSDVSQMTLLMDGMWTLVQRQRAEEKLKKSAEELARSNEELKSLDKMKDEFLSNVSHELKTPLISIKGFSEIMHDELYGPLNGKQKKAMDTVIRNSERLDRLINSILYLTLQNSGRDTYTMHPVNITEIIRNTIIDVSPQTDSKDLTIENKTQSDMPLIKADMDKLTQVFVNLFENAIKFTPDGGKITVEAFEDDENINITVNDTGIGISADVISNLFDRFYQVDASTTRRYGGTGIGLYISKLIVEVHKGRIWAESEEGVGTTFHVVLPK